MKILEKHEHNFYWNGV